jgi:hypothetical protein
MAIDRRRRALLAGLLLSACASPQPAPPTQTAYLRQTLDTKWLCWPPNDGFAATPVSETLAVGTMLDRFGSEGGRFFSPKGESYDARALPYACNTIVYTIYRVTRPIHVAAGKAAPWFDEPGGATQYETDETAFKLREAGALELVPGDAVATPCRGT